jgi:hypothetical protein
MNFMETSALDATNVEEAFKFVVEGGDIASICCFFLSLSFLFTEVYCTLGRRTFDGKKESYQVQAGVALPNRRNSQSVKQKSSCC